MMIKYLVFDFDGTLADTTEGILKTMEATLDRMGLPQADRSVVQKAIGLPLKGSIAAAGVPEDRLQEGVDVYHELFYEIAPRHIAIYPGVREALKELHSRGIRMGIATSRTSHSLLMLLEEHGLKDYFEIFGTVECVERPKPNPDLVQWVLARFGASPDETMVIGDTIYDIMMGSSALCHTCAVTYGNHNREQLSSALPELMIDNMAELPSLLW